MRASIKMVGYANHFYRSAHKFEQICRHRLRRQNVGYSNFSQPQSHLSFCVLLQYLVERRRVVTQLGKLALDEEKWLNMLGTFVKDWFRYESHFVHGRDSLVDILKERGLLSESDAVQPLIGKKS